ncbi:hypothetical protein [Nocardia altamirensis]|uniref:hypothetical protein n=1 Tax=Nocardia altamirensis TaxID=472158 RepID=UPI0008403371|nr:hypothetical protein [Nocardia altamirensis]
MSEQDQGDIFLRHRGAVLEALLTEPAEAPAPTESAPTEPEAASTPDPVPTEGPSTEPMAPPPPMRQRPGGEPRASDRIIALLNGAPPGAPFEPDFASDPDPVAASRTTTPQPQPPQQPQQQEASRLGSTQASAQRLLTQLRKPKVMLAVAGVLALLLVIVLATSGGKEKQDAAQLPVVTPSAAPVTSAPPTSGAASSLIQVKSAVSRCPAGSTPGMDAFGGQQGKAWSCERAFKIDGQVLTIELDKEYLIDSIGIVPGWDSVSADGVDKWSKYRTVSRVSYQFADPKTTTYTQQTLDQRTLVVTKLDPPVRASQIVLTVLASKGDPTVNTVAISSIMITGR